MNRNVTIRDVRWLKVVDEERLIKTPKHKTKRLMKKFKKKPGNVKSIKYMETVYDNGVLYVPPESFIEIKMNYELESKGNERSGKIYT